jgi:hypothetical protein
MVGSDDGSDNGWKPQEPRRCGGRMPHASRLKLARGVSQERGSDARQVHAGHNCLGVKFRLRSQPVVPHLPCLLWRGAHAARRHADDQKGGSNAHRWLALPVSPTEPSRAHGGDAREGRVEATD